MSQDIRRCSKADLDEMNRQMAVYKAGRTSTPHKDVETSIDAAQKDLLPDDGNKIETEQLDLWGEGLES